jgi:transcriptional regulator with XRE-family HTH domain
MAEHKQRVGQRIRAARENAGRSQSDLARLLPGKTEGPSVSRWERGVVMPRNETLDALAESLGVDVSYFLVAEPKARTVSPLDALTAPDDLQRQVEVLVVAVGKLLQAQDELAQLQAEDRRLLREVAQAVLPGSHNHPR